MIAYCIVNRNYRIEYLKGRKKREKSKYNHLCWIFYWTLLKKNAFKEKKNKKHLTILDCIYTILNI